METQRVQYRLWNMTLTGHGARYWSKVHMTAKPGITLCGKRFAIENADFDDKAQGRMCKLCLRKQTK